MVAAAAEGCPDDPVSNPGLKEILLTPTLVNAEGT